jgi:SAM-dependent methyltransferase
MSVDRSAGMWDERYSSDGYVYGREPNDFLKSMVPAIPVGGRVLCLADGEGRNGVFLSTLGFEVTTIDQSQRGVDKARRFASDSGVELDASVGDLAVTDLGEQQWDTIVSIFAHMPPDVRVGLHARVVQALKPGGLFVLEAYTPSQVGRGTGGPPVPELTMTLEGLRSELDGLTEEHGVEFVRPVVEGAGHTGDGAVVQYVGRRPTR